MSFKRLTLFLLFAISVFWGGDVSAQSRNRLYMQYIDTYKDLAIRHQKKYKIPASITLAQGLLESGAGRGTLARKSNNHFGIKCHNKWNCMICTNMTVRGVLLKKFLNCR